MYKNNLAELIDSEQMAQQEAGRRSMETLLNCYCREIAGPDSQLSVGPLFGKNDCPVSIRLALQYTKGQIMHVRLPYTGARLLTVVDGMSITGNFRYQSSFYCKSTGKPWALLDWETLAKLLLHEISLKNHQPPNDELMEQIRDSVAVTTAVLCATHPDSFSRKPLQAFIESEQSLIFGHPFHPAPKSRQGVSYEDMLRYSPETRTSFPLHYFAIRREYILQKSVLLQSCDQIISTQAPADLVVDKEFTLIPTHPWQARYLLKHSSVIAAIQTGKIYDLGQQGEHYYPTSSIRTLFHPENHYFYKCSLNIRITNCVRKNAFYELESALQITKIIREIKPSLERLFPDIRILEEPAFISVDLRQDDILAQEVFEGFGLILRQNISGVLAVSTTPLLSGALFGNHIYGEIHIQKLLDEMGLETNNTFEDTAEQWFSHYVSKLMYPVMYCYFSYGVIFEPHLQNVVIGIAKGKPLQIFLRDFEGVKLLKERYDSGQLDTISQRARESLWYSNDQGWKRVTYCLFVNNFCEAISQISAGNQKLWNRLWGVVRNHLQVYQSQFGDASSARRINALLNGEPFPGKANLTNRFFKRPDRESEYLHVNNPLGILRG